MIEIVFLGTGGGRFAMVTQKRRTGGIRLISEAKKINVHIDPGPGGLIYSIEGNLNPQKVNAILVSHSHPDHANDAEVLIEAMCLGTLKRKGILAAAHSVLFGNEICEPSISKYHQGMPKAVIEAKPGIRFKIKDMNVVVTKSVHSDPDTVGFRFETEFGDIAYMPDSEYFNDIKEFYEGARLLILSVLRPSGMPWEGHMTTDDAIQIIKETKPEKVIITHFGMKMIFRGPTHEASLIESRTGVPTIAAIDGMHVLFSKKIDLSRSKRETDLTRFLF